jgi:hypothetical protein
LAICYHRGDGKSPLETSWNEGVEVRDRLLISPDKIKAQEIGHALFRSDHERSKQRRIAYPDQYRPSLWLSPVRSSPVSSARVMAPARPLEARDPKAVVSA